MSHPFYPSGNPRFNHVAMSLPADLLGEESRKAVSYTHLDVYKRQASEGAGGVGEYVGVGEKVRVPPVRRGLRAGGVA